MTGPSTCVGRIPGDILRVEILSMRPRLPYGSNCAANWGLLYDQFGKERITIYALDDEQATSRTASSCSTARPLFGFDFRALAAVRRPGVVTPPDPSRASRSVARCTCR